MKYENKVWWFFFALYWFSTLSTATIYASVSMPIFPMGFVVIAIAFFISYYVPKQFEENKKCLKC